MSFKKLTAIFKIARPSNVFITFATIFAGVLIFSNEEAKKIFLIALIAGVAGALIDAGGNIINDFFDVEADRINKPWRPLPAGILSRKFALLLYLLSTLSGLILSLSLPVESFLIAIVSVVVIFFYSFIFKRIPLFGNFVVSFMTGLAFFFAGSAVKNMAEPIIPFVFAFLINFGREIVKDVEDIEGDFKAGVRTFPMIAGTKKALTIATLSFVALIIFTFVPYFLEMYRAVYFWIILAVDMILIYVIASLWRDQGVRNLNRLSNMLKFEMILGLLAIYFGSL